MKLATGIRVLNAALLNHGKGACVSRAASPSHASRSNEVVATVRRLLQRMCSTFPLSDHVLAVGLRSGKANTKTPRSLARLDPVFPRDSSGHSYPFSHQGGVVEISYLVPHLRANENEPARVGPMLPQTRAPLMKTPTGSAGPGLSSRTLTHVRHAASLPVKQVEQPTLRQGPVVTPRPPARSAGRYSPKSKEESHLSSRTSSLKPPAPSGAVRAATSVSRQGANGTRHGKAWVRTRILIPRRGVPRRGNYKPELPGPRDLERGHCSPKSPTRLSMVGTVGFWPFSRILHRQRGVVVAAPVILVAVVPFVACRRCVIFLRGTVDDGRKGQAF